MGIKNMIQKDSVRDCKTDRTIRSIIIEGIYIALFILAFLSIPLFLSVGRPSEEETETKIED